MVLVNTCGFIQAAKQESIDELLSAAESGAKVAAVGCLAERYGAELADELPEAQILSFDDYGDIGARLDDVLAGRTPPGAHRRGTAASCCPSAPPTASSAAASASAAPRPPSPPRARPAQAAPWVGPDPASGVFRRRLSSGVVAPLKIASGCDRRCSFCAIPSFRGAFVSRRPPEILAEARWLAARASASWCWSARTPPPTARTWGTCGCSRRCCRTWPRSTASTGSGSATCSPPSCGPGLIEVIAATPGVAPYFDLSFQHASGPVLRAMRRFGDRERFLALLDQIRENSPEAGVRSNFIVGFPGETAADLAELELFLARPGWTPSASSATPTRTAPRPRGRRGQLDDAEIARRVEDFADLAEELMAQRAADRMGETVDVLIEDADLRRRASAPGCSKAGRPTRRRRWTA